MYVWDLQVVRNKYVMIHTHRLLKIKVHCSSTSTVVLGIKDHSYWASVKAHAKTIAFDDFHPKVSRHKIIKTYFVKRHCFGVRFLLDASDPSLFLATNIQISA